jgi:hypothetical protein
MSVRKPGAGTRRIVAIQRRWSMRGRKDRLLSERRQFERYALDKRFGPFTTETPSFAVLTDISLSGAFVKGLHLPAIGESIIITYRPGTPEELTLVGRVVRTKESEPKGFGVCFAKAEEKMVH